MLWCEGCKTRACCSPFSQTVRLFACSVFKVIKTNAKTKNGVHLFTAALRQMQVNQISHQDTKTRTENIRKHFSFIKDSHVGNWNNVNNYTRFIPRETNNSGIIQSEVGLLEKKRASHITDEHRWAGQFRLSWDTFFFLLRGDYELTVHHQGFKGLIND